MRRPALVGLHLLFALSGAAGLGLQLTWTRTLSLGLGQEIPSTFGVLTTFFAGLALGARWFHRQRPDVRAQAFRCALLEGVIGAWSLATLWLLPEATELSWHWLGPAPSQGLHWAACFALPALTLLPATLAMGATLPAMEHLASSLHNDHRRLGPLYAANTFGAVLGVGLAILWTQPRLGLTRSLALFAGLNLVCALLLLAMGWSRTGSNAKAIAPSPNTPSIPGIPGIGFLLGITGLLGIGFEMLATRLLGQVLEDTVFTYAAILAVYLIGTATGAALQNRVATDPTRSVPSLLLGLAASITLAGWILPRTPELNGSLRLLLGDGLVASGISELGMALVIMGVPAVMMGLLFSTLASAARCHPSGLSRGVGWNLLGSAMAPAVIGFVALPMAGSRWTLIGLVLGYLALSRPRGGRWIAVIGVGLAVLRVPNDLHLQRTPPGGQILDLREGPSDTVTVLRQADGHRILRSNNRFTMGGTASVIAERRHGHLPLLFHPAPRRALFLGVGTGISFAALGTHPGVTADGVELSPEVAALQSAFSPHNDHGPQLRLHVADARRFVRASTERYDVIIADLFHPARDGAGGLYTREHFEAIRARLADGGMFCQWLPLFQLDLPSLQTITATFLSVFPDAHAVLLRLTADTPVLGLVGGTGPLQWDPEAVERRLSEPALREALRPLALAEVWPVMGSWFADSIWLRSLSSGAGINSDDHPIVLFQAPHTVARVAVPGQTLLARLLQIPRPIPPELLRNTTPIWNRRFEDYLAARDAYLVGLIAEADGDPNRAEAAFWDSLRRSQDFTSAYAQLISRATAQARTDPTKARRMLDQLTEARPDLKIAQELRRRLGL
jgi:spermidine synthase